MYVPYIFGCGIDIEEIERIKKVINNEFFLNDIYTDLELINNSKFNRVISFGICFCCKEAFFKALGYSWTNSKIDWKNIELIFKNNLNLYKIKLNGYARQLLKKNKIISIKSNYKYNKKYIYFKVILFQRRRITN